MNVVDLLELERIVHLPAARDKTRVFEFLSQCLASARPTASQAEILDSLVCREQLGSTGFGRGVAIPHGRIADLGAPIGALIKLKRGIDYDAPDGEPVDILFALLVPAAACDLHLELLAQLADMFSQQGLLAGLRASGSSRETLSLLRSEVARHAA